MQTNWEQRYARRMSNIKASFIRELLKVTQQPDVITFGGGFPASELFPIEKVRAACEKVLKENGQKALQYTTTEGYPPLRQWLADRLAQYGINVGADNVLITSGSQQALDFIGRVLLDEGDRILIESPTYLGALQAWNAYGAKYETVNTDDNGIVPEDFEVKIGTNVKFAYILPNFQNPMGVTLPLERRQKLVKIAAERGVPIIEDDPYGQLRFEGEPVKPLCVLDGELRKNDSDKTYNGNVVYISTFSKTLAPGLRMGWVVGHPDLIRKMVIAKQGTDLQCSTFDQYITYELVTEGFLDEHINLIRRVYKERRDAMIEAFEEFMPDGTTWTVPQGGLFLWLRLPEGCDALELFPLAIEEKVAYVPGIPFYPNGGPRNTMRLNFSAAAPERIREGVHRLSVMIKRGLTQAGSTH
jgi:2-aminoadipate transaminase